MEQKYPITLLTLSDYNKYNGAFLTNSDKSYILDKVPTEGLKFLANAEASILSMGFGQFVVTTSVVGIADLNLNKDILNLIFNGNTFADTIDITGTYSEAVGFVKIGLSHGRSVYTFGTRQISIGASINYLKGLGIERMVTGTGLASTHENGFAGEGNFIMQTSSGGSGYSFDFGTALRFNESYTAGLRFSNLFSKINWKNSCEEHGFLFRFDTMTVDNMDADYITTEDYSKSISSFSSSLPTVMNLGVAKTKGKILWAFDWEQGLSSKVGASKQPRLSVGLEYSYFSFLPLRTGFATGGNRNTAFSFGTGLKTGRFYFDMAAITGAMITSSSAKGVNFAFTFGINM